MGAKDFLVHFLAQMREYAAHMRISTSQDKSTKDLKDMILSFPDDIVPLIVDWDFSENFDVQHKDEMQSEHWHHTQVTLFIAILHYRVRGLDGSWVAKTEAHPVLSSDPDHDSHFVQGILPILFDSISKRLPAGKQFTHLYINSDGAPSHFKQRFTLFSMFKFKEDAKLQRLVYEFCGPGHGKGPWDGIGAVIKRFLRGLERQGRLYALNPGDCYAALLKTERNSFGMQGYNNTIDEWVYHYVRSYQQEELPEDLDPTNIHPPFARPDCNPEIDGVDKIRSRFYYEFLEDQMLVSRELSCRCEHCMEFNYKECNFIRSNPVFKKKMRYHGNGKQGVNQRNRSLRENISKARRAKAMSAEVGSYVALEPEDDPDSRFWLAKVEAKCEKYVCKRPHHNHNSINGCYKDEATGVIFKHDLAYIKVRNLERVGDANSREYKVLQGNDVDAVWTIDAEAVCCLVDLSSSGRSRSRLEISEEDAEKCANAASDSWKN